MIHPSIPPVIRSRWMAGESCTSLAEDYAISVGEVRRIVMTDDPILSLVAQIQAEDLEMLRAKQAVYGCSATDPIHVFSRLSAAEALKVRIDDKLSRIARGSDAGEDTLRDLRGYLLLLEAVTRIETGTPPASDPPGGDHAR